jgi:hypothetical protein
VADNYRRDPADEEHRKFDPYVHAVTVITEPHRMIHDGFYFSASGIDLDLANGASFDILIKLPAGQIGHMTLIEYAIEDAPATITFYEGVTTSADGTAVNTRNHNRVIANDTSSSVITYDPTVTDVGTKLYEKYVPQANGGGAGPGGGSGGSVINGESEEWVLGSPTDATAYLWRLTNNSGGIIDLSYHLSGYEIGYQE